jgi:hypothetical protein
MSVRLTHTRLVHPLRQARVEVFPQGTADALPQQPASPPRVSVHAIRMPSLASPCRHWGSGRMRVWELAADETEDEDEEDSEDGESLD